MTTEVTKFNFEITSMQQAMDYAKMIANSDLAPKDYKGKPGNVIIAIQYGLEIGLKPMQAIQNIAVINGRPAIWGDAMIALVQNHPLCEYIVEEFKNGTAYCTVKRRGESEEHVAKFSKEDAKKAGLIGKVGPWSQYEDRMLQMRARAFALRDKFSDILKGIAIREEVMDYQEIEPRSAKITVAQNKISKLIHEKTEKVSDNKDVDIIKNIIKEAEALQHLDKIPDMCKSIQDPHLSELRNLYSEKKRLLSSANKDTGEIADTEEQSSELTEYDKIKKQLTAAKSRDTLDIAADLIETCDTEEQKESLRDIYNKRKEQVK